MILRLINEEELRREAERPIKAGKMPTLDELTQAILSTRREYATKIRRARRENREEMATLIAAAMRNLE